MNTDDEGRPYKENDGESGKSLVEASGHGTLQGRVNEATKVFGNVEPVKLPRLKVVGPSLEKIQSDYNERHLQWKKTHYKENLALSDWAKREIEGHLGEGFYGLVVLHANDDGIQTYQHGWPSLYFPIDKLNISKRYKNIKAIRSLTEKKVYEVEWSEEKKEMVFRLDEKGKKLPGYEAKVKIPLVDKRLWLYEHNIIDEIDIYAWFYDLVWRQNNQGILIETEQGKKVIENFSGRWNKKRPFGYQVRERLRGVLEKITNPLHLVLSISDEKIFPLMPYNTNLDVVMFSIINIGKWIREFLQRLYHYQERRNIDWQFKGWVLEFQGGKEDTAERSYLNRGFPHPHLIFAGNWLGKIQEIQNSWPYGRVDLTTVKDIQKRRPGIKLDGLRLANYLTKYVSKASRAITDAGVHKGYAWLAFSGGRVFSIKHEKKEIRKTEEKQ